MTRRAIDAQVRLEAIARIKNGEPQKTVASSLGVGLSTLEGWARDARRGKLPQKTALTKLPRALDVELARRQPKRPPPRFVGGLPPQVGGLPPQSRRVQLEAVIKDLVAAVGSTMVALSKARACDCKTSTLEQFDTVNVALSNLLSTVAGE